MNQTRRDILKAMLLAPVAGLAPVASSAPKPVVMDLPVTKPQKISAIQCAVTIRHFVLAVPSEVARRSFVSMLDVVSRTNADKYRGFEPGSLRCTGWEIPEINSDTASRIDFESRTSHTATGELREVHDFMVEFEKRNRVSFAVIPDGKWYELPPSFEMRIVYTNQMGEVIG